MKTKTLALSMLITGAVCAHGQSLQQSAAGTAVLTPYQVVAGGPHERVWQSVSVDANGMTNRHSYTELATGLNFWNPATRQWEESKEQFYLTKEGYAVATNGQHSLILAPDIASAGAVDLLNPDGVRLVSNPMGLSFADSATGKNVLIAQVTNCLGELASENSVVYGRAFDAVRAAIRLSYTRSGVEQDVILYQQLPSPSEWGLDPATTRIEMWTEVLGEPVPQVSQVDWSGDRVLDFGQTRIGHGVAYLLNGQMMDQVGLEKDWVEADGRHFIVESVSYAAVKPLLDKLQASAGEGKGTETAQRKAHASRNELARAFARRAKPKEMAAIQRGRMSQEPGVLLDYQTINTSQTNYVFKGDTTYWLSGNVALFGTNTTFEAGTILKSTNGVSLTVNTPIAWLGTMWRPVILTSKDDTSCGDSISGATGSPGSNVYAATALAIGVTNTVTIQHLRVANAQTAISFVGGSGHVIRHAQFVACQKGIAATNTDFSLGNALFWNVLTNFTGASSTGRVEHLTADTATYLNQNLGTNLFLTNCLLVNVTNTGSYSGLSNAVTTSGSVFQTVGEGFHYLLNGTYRDSGTTNISATLAADLRKMTTFPPLISTNAITTATTWSPQAQRDTDTPDLGYHYYPLDFLVNNVSTSSSLTLTNGVAVGVYGSYGVIIQGGNLYSQGSPVNLNVLTRYQTVQEQPATLGSSALALINVATTAATITQLRFTDCPALGLASTGTGARDLLDNNSYPNGTFILRDCQLRGSAINIYQGNSSGTISLSLTNNLMERGSFYANRTGAAMLIVNLRNNLFWRSALNLQYNSSGTNPTWNIQDNLFDNCSITEGGNNYQFYIGNSYNGYVATTPLGNSGGNDKSVTTFAYATGTLGPWYQSSTNMIDAGSRTADLAGLYHYTTQTSQVKEATTIVDLGFHYVATDANGNPIDTNGNGFPDWQEDANGNGVVDSGETDWQHGTDLGLKVWITEPKRNANLP